MSSEKKDEDPHPSSTVVSIENSTIIVAPINVAPGTMAAATAATISAAVMIVSPGPDSYSVEYLTFSRHLIPFY